MAVILAASMAMSSGFATFAESVEEVNVNVNSTEVDEEYDSVTKYGVDASGTAQTDDAKATVDVSGNVDAEPGQNDYNGESEGIKAKSSSQGDGKDATTEVSVGGNVTEKAEDEGWGINASSDSRGKESQATTNVTVGGGVSSEARYDYGVSASALAYGEK